MQRHLRQIKQELDRNFESFYVKKECSLHDLLTERLRLAQGTELEAIFAKLAPLRTPRSKAEEKAQEIIMTGESFDPSEGDNDADLQEFVTCQDIVYLQRLHVLALTEDLMKGEEEVEIESLASRCGDFFFEPHRDAVLTLVKPSTKGKKSKVQQAETDSNSARKWFHSILTKHLVRRDLYLSFVSLTKGAILTSGLLGDAFKEAGLDVPAAEVLKKMLDDTGGASSFQDVWDVIERLGR
jgi:hypothetical protein